MLRAWGRGGVEVWRSGATKACWGPGDVEEVATRGLEMRYKRVDVEV